MVKNLKGWELSNDKLNVGLKSFRGVKTSHMYWHVKPTIAKNPENIIIHCDTNDISKDADPEKIAADIKNLSKSFSEERGSNVIISGLVPRKGCHNAKVRNLNSNGVSLFNENFVSLLNTLDLENNMRIKIVSVIKL